MSLAICFAELMAIRQGLQLAWDNGYRRVWCEDDSKEVIRIILSYNKDSNLF